MLALESPPPAGVDPNGESSFPVLIPGLPYDLALSCLTKVSHGYHGILESVSKRWRDAVRSLDYSRLKASQGSCGNWLFVLTEDSLLWEAYDPRADRWHPLPMMPRPKPEHSHHGFSCVSLYKRLFVLGGFYSPSPSNVGPSHETYRTRETNDAFIFDPFEKKWTKVASMQIARSDFACAAINGKVYVAGGSHGVQGLSHAEVYDPVGDRWKDLPLMPIPLVDCFSVSHGGRFHVLGKRNKYQIQNDTYAIFDPSKESWEVVDDLWSFDRLVRQTTIVLRDQIYTINEGDMTLKIMDTNQRESKNISKPPSVVLPLHRRALQPFGYGFLELEGKFYVFAGKAVKYDADALEFDVVKLTLVRYCDPEVAPSDWIEARPMFHSRGAVVGCASTL